MSLYISPDGQFPRHVGDILITNPSWKKGDPLPEGWREVNQTAVPSEPGKKAIYSTPIEVDGQLVTTYELVDIPVAPVSSLSQDKINNRFAQQMFDAYQNYKQTELNANSQEQQ